MRTTILGAGPAGLLTAAGLARRGHDVTIVDRDGGPAPDGTWARRGVMQFHHAHGVRRQAVDAVIAEAPEALDRMLAVGAELDPDPDRPGGNLGLRCRRVTFETVLRHVVLSHPRVRFFLGHADQVAVHPAASGAGTRAAAGLVVDGRLIPADLVVDASGRSGRVTTALREPVRAGGVCGIAYVDRQYQLRPGATRGPLQGEAFWVANLPGYQAIVFLHERGIFSVLLVRPSDSRDLLGLRHAQAFDAACRAIPGLDEWTDPARSRPITDVLPGGTLLNAYRGQRGPDGDLALPGLVFVGDSVATTTPIFGRGLATSLMQVQELLRLVEEYDVLPSKPSDITKLRRLTEDLDRWDDEQMLPWVRDHERMDDAMRRRWAGEDDDLSRPLPSDRILAAAAVDPRIGAVAAPYLSMHALPTSLDAVEPLARAVYRTGWRPSCAPGPTRSELAALVARTREAA